MRLLVSGQSRVGTGPEFEARPGWETKFQAPARLRPILNANTNLLRFRKSEFNKYFGRGRS